MPSPPRALADRLAEAGVLPTSVRAVLGYYGSGGALALSAIPVQRRAEARVEAIVDDAFADVEAALADEFDREAVSFSYDTKLTLPVELTLGHVYRRNGDADAGGDGTEAVSEGDESEVAIADDVAELVVEALLDGDMRDAINDDEYDDFAVDFAADADERARVAEVAQAVLKESVESRFDRFPGTVREAYDWAVEVSEAHQARDPHFRDLFGASRAGEAGARDDLRAEYRDAEFDDRPDVFTDAELDLPYLKTQYGRVGVIYDGMVEMFREAGVDLERAFKRSVVLAIIGAQVWLDDVDDFEADMAEGQLTPVTAEYLLADDRATARRRVLDLTDRYLDRATAAAAESDSPLTGIAVEYIRYSGDPSVLPG